MKQIFFISAVICLTVTHKAMSREIEISNPSCTYRVHIPDGWDTIPNDTIRQRVKMLKLDTGLYPASQAGCFDGEYLLIGFMPSMQPLPELPFKQIAAAIENQGKAGSIESDTMTVRFEKMTADDTMHCLHSCYTVIKDTVVMKNRQSLYLSRFGYVSVTAYKRANTALNDEMPPFMPDLITVDDKFKYSEPVKSSITTHQVIISLAVGFAVFIIITLATGKRRKP